MDWIKGIQNAIDYIEENLTNDPSKLTIYNIAKQAYSSEFHFQRVFGILTNMTIGDYIRKRRLTLAGEELAISDTKIIDIALKYGYATPQSFTKAFYRFHGVSPNSVRHNSKGLKSFSRLGITFKLEGGSLLDYYVRKHSVIKILGKQKKFSAADLTNNNEGIVKFCKSCYADGTVEKLFKLGNNNGYLKNCVIGLHDTIGCKMDEGEIRYSLGIQYTGKDIPEGFKLVEIPAQNWIKFQVKGYMPDAIQGLWYRVYTEFMPFSSYSLKEDLTMEVCPYGFDNDETYKSELWIVIK